MRLRSAALNGKSPLYRWMLDNYQSFSAAIERADKTPDWKAIAATFASDGLTDSKGNPPVASVASGTWYRVQKAVSERNARKKAVSRGKPKSLAPGIVRPASPGFTAIAGGSPKPRYTFKPSSLKKMETP